MVYSTTTPTSVNRGTGEAYQAALSHTTPRKKSTQRINCLLFLIALPVLNNLRYAFDPSSRSRPNPELPIPDSKLPNLRNETSIAAALGLPEQNYPTPVLNPGQTNTNSTAASNSTTLAPHKNLRGSAPTDKLATDETNQLNSSDYDLYANSVIKGIKNIPNKLLSPDPYKKGAIADHITRQLAEDTGLTPEEVRPAAERAAWGTQRLLQSIVDTTTYNTAFSTGRGGFDSFLRSVLIGEQTGEGQTKRNSGPGDAFAITLRRIIGRPEFQTETKNYFKNVLNSNEIVGAVKANLKGAASGLAEGLLEGFRSQYLKDPKYQREVNAAFHNTTEAATTGVFDGYSKKANATGDATKELLDRALNSKIGVSTLDTLKDSRTLINSLSVLTNMATIGIFITLCLALRNVGPARRALVSIANTLQNLTPQVADMVWNAFQYVAAPQEAFNITIDTLEAEIQTLGLGADTPDNANHARYVELSTQIRTLESCREFVQAGHELPVRAFNGAVRWANSILNYSHEREQIAEELEGLQTQRTNLENIRDGLAADPTTVAAEIAPRPLTHPEKTELRNLNFRINFLNREHQRVDILERLGPNVSQAVINAALELNQAFVNTERSITNTRQAILEAENELANLQVIRDGSPDAVPPEALNRGQRAQYALLERTINKLTIKLHSLERFQIIRQDGSQALTNLILTQTRDYTNPVDALAETNQTIEDAQARLAELLTSRDGVEADTTRGIAAVTPDVLTNEQRIDITLEIEALERSLPQAKIHRLKLLDIKALGPGVSQAIVNAILTTYSDVANATYALQETQEKLDDVVAARDQLVSTQGLPRQLNPTETRQLEAANRTITELESRLGYLRHVERHVGPSFSQTLIKAGLTALKSVTNTEESIKETHVSLLDAQNERTGLVNTRNRVPAAATGAAAIPGRNLTNPETAQLKELNRTIPQLQTKLNNLRDIQAIGLGGSQVVIDAVLTATRSVTNARASITDTGHVLEGTQARITELRAPQTPATSLETAELDVLERSITHLQTKLKNLETIQRTFGDSASQVAIDAMLSAGEALTNPSATMQETRRVLTSTNTRIATLDGQRQEGTITQQEREEISQLNTARNALNTKLTNIRRIQNTMQAANQALLNGLLKTTTGLANPGETLRKQIQNTQQELNQKQNRETALIGLGLQNREPADETELSNITDRDIPRLELQIEILRDAQDTFNFQPIKGVGDPQPANDGGHNNHFVDNNNNPVDADGYRLKVHDGEHILETPLDVARRVLRTELDDLGENVKNDLRSIGKELLDQAALELGAQRLAGPLDANGHGPREPILNALIRAIREQATEARDETTQAVNNYVGRRTVNLAIAAAAVGVTVLGARDTEYEDPFALTGILALETAVGLLALGTGYDQQWAAEAGLPLFGNVAGYVGRLLANVPIIGRPVDAVGNLLEQNLRRDP